MFHEPAKLFRAGEEEDRRDPGADDRSDPAEENPVEELVDINREPFRPKEKTNRSDEIRQRHRHRMGGNQHRTDLGKIGQH